MSTWASDALRGRHRLLILPALGLLSACGHRDTVVGVAVDGGPGSRVDGGLDGGSWDPFDPDAACGLSIIPTERVPGSLLLVFDRSGSMSETPDRAEPTAGNPSKWDRVTRAMDEVLGAVSGDLGAGLLLFPTGEGATCDVTLSAAVPQVPIAPLATSRAAISAALAGTSPGPEGTAVFDAIRAGYGYLDTLDTAGQRGIVLVTDGAETCDWEDRETVLAQAESEREAHGYLTFVVGLTQADSDLSTLAHNGGTPRNDTCLPRCTTSLCRSSAECAAGVACSQPVPGFPGFCSCERDADCPAPLTCQPLPLLGNQCVGQPNCCHHNATAASFEADFTEALEAIARRVVDGCVFDLPRGGDPEAFDPALVNVGVTFPGEPRTVLRRSDDPDRDSWDYTSAEQRSLVIQGLICDRLLVEPATVEIALGCPTILF